jgi:acyl-phosphate glycerol 3-phosphate acyltransferase
MFCLVFLSYLAGSISFAVIVSKLMLLPSPYSYGSENPGATNVLRTGNKLAAFFTLLGDTAKGFLAVKFLPVCVLPDTALLVHAPVATGLALIGVLLGHVFPIFHFFKGGEGCGDRSWRIVSLKPGGRLFRTLNLVDRIVCISLFIFSRDLCIFSSTIFCILAYPTTRVDLSGFSCECYFVVET